MADIDSEPVTAVLARAIQAKYSDLRNEPDAARVVWNWNDSDYRSHSDVVEMFGKAAELAEKEGVDWTA